MKRNIAVKKVIISVSILAAVTLLITGATYASLNARTESVVNDFQGACVNIGVVEKNSGDVVILEDEGTNEAGTYDVNKNNNSNEYVRISESGRTVSKEVAVKNITSEDYPTTDTSVRVRFVPVLVYDDNELNQSKGVSGQTVPVDMRDSVDYILADGVMSQKEYEEYKKNGESDDKARVNWVYNESSTGDINDRYYYCVSPLAPGEVSALLLKAVTYKTELPDNTHFELRVLAEGIADSQRAFLK